MYVLWFEFETLPTGTMCLNTWSQEGGTISGVYGILEGKVEVDWGVTPGLEFLSCSLLLVPNEVKNFLYHSLWLQ